MQLEDDDEEEENKKVDEKLCFVALFVWLMQAVSLKGKTVPYLVFFFFFLSLTSNSDSEKLLNASFA